MDAPWAETRAGSGRPHASSHGAATNQHVATHHGFRSNRTFVLSPHYLSRLRYISIYVHYAWKQTIGADNISCRGIYLMWFMRLPGDCIYTAGQKQIVPTRSKTMLTHRRQPSCDVTISCMLSLSLSRLGLFLTGVVYVCFCAYACLCVFYTWVYT